MRQTGLLIGSAARFRFEKGLDVLIEAAVRLLPKRPDLFCVLAGEGPDRPALEHRVARTGLADRILFPGFIEDIPMLMRALSALIVPSRSEGLPFAVMEAMATGTPPVASDVGGLTEMIDDGVNGVLVPSDDSVALSNVIADLLDRPAHRQTMAGRAFRSAAAYDIDRYVARMADLYRALAQPA